MGYILKWTVPVDDQLHEIGGGPVVHVASQSGRIDEVQVWTQEYDVNPVAKRSVKVVGTGQKFNDFAITLGSVVVADGNIVWHVIKFL